MSKDLTVKPADIDASLKRIWDKLEGTNKMRACLFNLIFYAEAGPRADYIRTIAKKVVEKFPSRVIFILADQNAKKDELTTKVSVLSTVTGEYEVACDLIEIGVSGSMRTRVPLIILPHILSDLPIYFIWGEDPTSEDPIFVELRKIATRLIFDSESAPSLPTFAKALLFEHNLAHSEVSDLNWARTENWRDVLSSTFYSANKFEQLKNVTEIKITYNASSTAFFCRTNIQAVYLQTWLAAQLNWKMKSVKKEQAGLTFLYDKENAPVSITLIPIQQATLAPGMIFSIDMSISTDYHYNFTCHLDQPHKITLSFSTHELCEMPAHFLFAKGEKGQSLVKEICQRGTSVHYLKVLERVSKIEETQLC